MTLRMRNLMRLRNEMFDFAVIGGGINGAVAAAALGAQGLRVALIDRGDFAHETSQASSNLAWGGIKYLETGELKLVRSLCRSRNRLIESYPSSIREIRFHVTVEKAFRHHRATLYFGAWLYWLMGNGFTRPPRLLSLADIEREESTVNTRLASGGFEFSDAYVVDTDARFVFGFVRRALNQNVAVANYVESRGSARDSEGCWQTRVRDAISGDAFTVRSRALINACGPSVEALNELNGIESEHRHVFSKGVHLIVNRITDSNRVLTFFADDGRLFFVIPFDSKSCIGTTDTRVTTLPATVTAADRRFILDNINKRLALPRPLSEADIIAERCGVRPLAVSHTQTDTDDSDWTALSRRHALEVNSDSRCISIFGGKLTDCLNIGDEIIAAAQRLKLCSSMAKNDWYGEPPRAMKEEFVRRAGELGLDESASTLSSEPMSERWWRRYGLDALRLLEETRRDPCAAKIVMEGTPFTRCELEYAAQNEMITKLQDFLRRRSTIALTFRPQEIARLPGLMEACHLLFGADARLRFDEYFEALRSTADAEQFA